MIHHFTAISEPEDNVCGALCSKLDIASQRDSIAEEARGNPREAMELFIETASPNEIGIHLHDQSGFTDSLNGGCG